MFFLAAACRSTVGPYNSCTAIPVRTIMSRRNIGLFLQAFAGWGGLKIGESLQVPSLWPVTLKESSTVPAVGWPHVLDWQSCYGVAEDNLAGMEMALPAAAVVPAAAISASMAATTISLHLSPPHPEHPRPHPCGWWGGGEGLLGMREEKGKKPRVQTKEERGALQSDNDQPQNPDQAVLASDIGLLPGQEGQHCTALFKLRQQKTQLNTSDEKSLVGWGRKEKQTSKMYWAKPDWQLPCLACYKGKCAAHASQHSSQRSPAEIDFWEDLHKLAKFCFSDNAGICNQLP